MLKNENSNVVFRLSELKPLRCNVLLLCPYAHPKRKNLRSTIVFSNVFENFKSQTMLSGILRFPKLRISTGFRRAQKYTSKISRKSTENRMTKGIGFIKSDLKSAKSTVFGRRVPKEWDFIFYQLYRFQKMPKRILPLFPQLIISFQP